MEMSSPYVLPVLILEPAPNRCSSIVCGKRELTLVWRATWARPLSPGPAQGRKPSLGPMSLGCKSNLGNSCCLPGSPPSHLVPPPGTLFGWSINQPIKITWELVRNAESQKKKKKKQSLRPHFRSTEPESLGVGSSICAFTSSSGVSNACYNYRTAACEERQAHAAGEAAKVWKH